MKSKRIFTLMLALVMTLSLAACGGSKQEETPADNAGNGEAAGDTQDFGGAELVVATWGWAEAGLKTLAADFESKYNCTIVVDPTSGNGDRLNKLMAEQNDPTADVALLTKSFAQTGNEAGLFEKIGGKDEVEYLLWRIVRTAWDGNRFGFHRRKPLPWLW